MNERNEIFYFLEHNMSNPPNLITAERTQTSKYQFYLLVRAYHRKLRMRPQFFQYDRNTVNNIKGLIEEHSVFGEKSLYVLEGFNSKFVESLEPPKDNYIVAATDGGQLKAVAFRYKYRRDALKVLKVQLNLNHLSLRALLKLDWSVVRSFEEMEGILLKGKVMDWDEEKIGEQLEKMEMGQILLAMKRPYLPELYNTVRKYGRTWTYKHMVTLLGQLIHYKALRSMGYEDYRCEKEMEISYYRRKELEESSKTLTSEDIKLLCERMINLDWIITTKSEIGTDLYFLNSPIRVRK